MEYVPYEEGSGKRFKSYNIPPNLKSKSNQVRQDFQWMKNEEIKKANREKKRDQEEMMNRQKLELEKFKKMKEKITATEKVKRTDDDTLKLHAIIQVMTQTGQSFCEGMNAAELRCW